MTVGPADVLEYARQSVRDRRPLPWPHWRLHDSSGSEDPPVNLNDVMDEKLTTWQRIAKAIATIAASRAFLFAHAVGFVAWITVFAPYPLTYFPRGGLIDMITSPLPALLLLVATVALMLTSRRMAAASVMVASFPWLMILLGDALWLDGLGGSVVTASGAGEWHRRASVHTTRSGIDREACHT